jgi:two-component system sensor histidine kinase AlgZ
MFLFAALAASRPTQFAERVTGTALTVEPVVAFAVPLCYALSRLLGRLRYGLGVTVVALAVAAAAVGVSAITAGDTGEPGSYWLLRTVLCSVLGVLLLAEYLRLRNRALSPAFAEARLQSLQARIRPHFLFNSLNAVLSVMRSDPRRAERVMEDLADLFRTLMADNARLVPLARELELVQDYLRIESLRLGDRLRVECNVDPRAESSLVPPLFLQPLVENAVHHGVEPRRDPGTVTVQVRREGSRIRVSVSNPAGSASPTRPGNRMALSNIRERLALHYDAHATLESAIVGDRYEVSADLPFRDSH